MATVRAPVGAIPTPPSEPDGVPPQEQVERLLAEVVAICLPAPPALPGPGRPPLLSAALVWTGLLVGVLRQVGSQRECWRLLAGYGLHDQEPVAVSDQAFYHRLARAGSAPLVTLFTAISAALAARATPSACQLAPFARALYALDTTTLDALARRLPPEAGPDAGSDTGTPREDRARLAGKLAGVFDIRAQRWVRVERLDDAAENDKLSARRLVQGLPPGILLVFDLGYFGFQWFDELTQAGYWWVSRLRAGTSTRLIHVFYQQGDTLDALVWLGAHRADRARHAVRLVQFRQGGVLRRYITNVRDPETLPLAEIAALYARRWDFEMAVQLIKEHLGLRLWWSAKLTVVEQQLWAVLIIAQVVQALRLEIAVQARVDPFDVSLPLMVRHLPRLAAAGQDPIAVFVRDGERLGFIRPSRRVVIRAPVIDPAELVPRPVGLSLVRAPRYARRRST